MTTVDEVLEHHGIKGQKWGVRNQKSVKPSSHDHRKVSELRNRKAHQLTNKQLKSINERRNLEQNFHRLNPSKVKKGFAAVTAILAVAKTAQSAHQLLTSPGGKAAVNAGKIALSSGKIGANLRKP